MPKYTCTLGSGLVRKLQALRDYLFEAEQYEESKKVARLLELVELAVQVVKENKF